MFKVRLRPLNYIVVNDLNRIIKGFFKVIRYFLSRDEIPVDLSLFSTNTGVIEKGKFCKYEIIIANNDLQHLWVRLLIDIYLKSNPHHPEGHYAYFEKRIFVKSHESQSVEFYYNWDNNVLFNIDGISMNPDTTWKGSCKTKDKYFVHALLLNEEGNLFNRLTVIQELRR